MVKDLTISNREQVMNMALCGVGTAFPELPHHGNVRTLNPDTFKVHQFLYAAGPEWHWNRWIPRGVSFLRPRHRLIAVASLGRLSRNRSIRVWFTRYPRTALSDMWRSLGITSLRNIGGIRYVHIHSYIGHHDQACVLACKIQCISKYHEIKLKS
ncbi:hypothetical protein TNCV_2954221 [Trichonephila clavipes]|nr:hypothetical protein TNCV_2954221 [Trichonephila clavipes]